MSGRILIVEDEALIALELEARLSDLGYTVVGTASTGREALAIVKEVAPHLVLLDIHLGGSDPDGAEVARLLNASDDVCIVFVTAHTDPQTLERVRQATPYGFVRKPFDPMLLEITVRTALDRCMADRARRIAESRSRAVLDAASDAVLAIDADGCVVLGNPAAERLFGGRVEGRPIQDLLAGDPSTADPEAALALGPEAVPVTLRWSEVPQDPEIRRMVQIRDVSRQRALEAQNARAQQMEAVGRLGGGLAHDFGNLLLAMDLNVWLLQESGCDTESHLEQLRLALEQARSLSSQLLALQRPRPAERILVCPVAALRRLQGLVERVLGQVRVVFDLDPGTPTVRVHRGRLEQVVLNLVMNARDAMPDGGSLTVRARRRDGGATIEVIDDGCGMPESVRARVFDPFFTTKQAGTGLGLSTSRDIVTAMGGRMAVHSAPGSGTRVELWIPADRGDASQAVPVPPPLPRRAGHALVVLSEPVARHAIATTLRAMGVEASVHDRPEGALEAAAAAETIDLVVTDDRLPGMRGAILGRTLRERHPEAAVLVLASEEVDAPWARVLYGPSSRDEIVQALTDLLPA